jgi:hypothetical protein
MDLRRFGTKLASVFSLNGLDENSATYALGWVMSKSDSFCMLFVKDVINLDLDVEKTSIELQKYDREGFTDIEIICASICHILVEAKRGWTLPGTEQLERYAKRINTKLVNISAIVSLSAASQEYAQRRQSVKVNGIPLIHRSWDHVYRLICNAYRKASSHEEKFWLKELGNHIKEYVSMQNPRDNMVFVVSLSSKPIKEGDSYSWVDVVEKEKRYFHPVGNRWPVIPPNYIGFRYDGKLQSVHHVDDYEVATNLIAINPKWPPTDFDCFLYTLGPAMFPPQDIKNGSIWPSGRYECAIDTLLSGRYTTISKARDETQRRLKLLGS